MASGPPTSSTRWGLCRSPIAAGLGALALKPHSRLTHEDRHYTITGLRFSSNLEGCPAGDLFLYFVGRVSDRAFGTRMGMVAAAVYAPFSRGAVTLRSRDPEVPPNIAQGLFIPVTPSAW